MLRRVDLKMTQMVYPPACALRFSKHLCLFALALELIATAIYLATTMYPTSSDAALELIENDWNNIIETDNNETCYDLYGSIKSFKVAGDNVILLGDGAGYSTADTIIESCLQLYTDYKDILQAAIILIATKLVSIIILLGTALCLINTFKGPFDQSLYAKYPLAFHYPLTENEHKILSEAGIQANNRNHNQLQAFAYGRMFARQHQIPASFGIDLQKYFLNANAEGEQAVSVDNNGVRFALGIMRA